MKKYVKKGVAFVGMRHLFLRNATPIQRNATPFLKKKHYICTMKEILETMPRIELALIIIGVLFTRTSLLPLHQETSLNELVNGC